jgi:hypothetical protein
MPHVNAEDIARRAMAAFQQIKAAQEDVRLAGLHPIATDSAASVYLSALEQMGLPAAQCRDLAAAGVAGARTVFLAYQRNRPARQRLAAIASDSAAAQSGFAARFPNVRPVRHV